MHVIHRLRNFIFSPASASHTQDRMATSMNQSQRLIDRVFGWVALLALLIALASVSWRATAQRQSDEYKVGQRMDGIGDVRFSTSSKTLVLWVDSRCHFCTESMAFYRHLSQQANNDRLVVVGREPAEVLQNYLARFHVSAARVVSVGDSTLRFRGTPTLLLVGQDSVIRGVWTGKLQSDKKEREVLNVLE